MPFALTLLLLLGPAPSPALAAPSAVPTLRAQLGLLQTQVGGLLDRQAALRSELNNVSAQAERLKAAGEQGNRLQGLLRRSQVLSDQLSSLARELASDQATQQRLALTLAQALDVDVARARQAWETESSAQARGELTSRMRRLEQERDSMRNLALPVESVALPAPVPVSDDPAELLEQADALRDSRDKLQQQLTLVEARIRDQREQRELDQRLEEFDRREDLMDEQVRNLKRTVTTAAAPPPEVAHGPVSAQAPIPLQTTVIQDQRPQVNDSPVAPDSPGEDNLPVLEQRKARLEALLRELDQRVQGLEQRARQLR